MTKVKVKYRHYKDGRVKSIIPKLYGNNHGVARYYRKDSGLKITYQYSRGDRDGLSVSYWKNGLVRCIENYAFDLLNGLRREYRRDGSLLTSVFYINGDIVGTSTVYRRDGSVKSVAEFSNNILNGHSVAFTRKGLVKWRKFYKDGILDLEETNRLIFDSDVCVLDTLKELASALDDSLDLSVRGITHE